MRANVPCEYDTERADERRSQALRRRYKELDERQAQVRDSLCWLRAQSAGTILSCMQQIQSAEDPADALCNIVAEERAGPPPAEIFAHQILVNMSHGVRKALTTDLPARFPATFPTLPVTASQASQEHGGESMDEAEGNVAESWVLMSHCSGGEAEAD